MGSEPEAQEDDEDWGLPLEMSPQLEGRKWSLFFRLARKRADYFSDIEDILRMPDIDQLPTRDLSAFRRAIEAILTQPEGLLSIAEQPTRLSWMIEQPTRPLPGPMEQPTGVRSTPALLRGAADMRAEQPGGRESGPRRCARKHALAGLLRLLARGTLWWPRRLRERANAKQFSSSLQ